MKLYQILHIVNAKLSAISCNNDMEGRKVNSEGVSKNDYSGKVNNIDWSKY